MYVPVVSSISLCRNKTQEFVQDRFTSIHYDPLKRISSTLQRGRPQFTRTALNKSNRPVRNCVCAFTNVAQRPCHDSLRQFSVSEQERPIGYAITDLKNRQRQGTKIDSYTLVDALKQCLQKKDLTAARQVHDFVIQIGMDKHPYVATALMNVYVRCGRLLDARRVFDGLEKKSYFSWSIMIGGYAKNDHVEDALEVFNRMRQEGAEPGELLCLSILKAYASPSALKWGNQVHEYIRDAGLKGIRRFTLKQLRSWAGTVLPFCLSCTRIENPFRSTRSLVDKDGDYHRAVHVWIYAESTGQLLLQRRAHTKDSHPGMWDISSAGHISAGKTSLETARRELEEELGVALPSEAFELLFVYLQNDVLNNGTFINQYCDVYLVTTVDPIPSEAFTLQEEEVVDVKYIDWKQYKEILKKGDPAYVDYGVDEGYGQLFEAIENRYEANPKARIASLKQKLQRFAPVTLPAEIAGLGKGDTLALAYTIEAAKVLDEIFLEQEWGTNPDLKSWLEKSAKNSELDKLKYDYFLINKSPWSSLDENEAYLTTADSAIHAAENALKPVPGFKGVQWKAAFPLSKSPNANFYPRDMDKKEFELWKSSLTVEEQDEATSFFTAIRRAQPRSFDLKIVPYSTEYSRFLEKAADFLHKAGDAAETPSLKRLLKAKADAFRSNDYYDSDIAWMELDSPVDVTIGPYETYEDKLLGCKATFEAYIGIRDDDATSKLRLFSERLQELEDNLPFASEYKSKGVAASPIRVINLLLNAGDAKGPQTVAFNLPNDVRIIKERGSAMVMMKNLSEAKFEKILQPIAVVCVDESQRKYVDFDAFFTHTICHECCHGIGPHNIVVKQGKESTVRLELQELYSPIEEAKADIVGLWALHYLLDKGLLPDTSLESIYASYLAGCFRSIRFGLEAAHGKGQALQFNYILEKGGFVLNKDGTFAVNFEKIRGVVEDLSRQILTIEAQGDKPGAKSLLDKYVKRTPEISRAFAKLEEVQVPTDIVPDFAILKNADYLNAAGLMK